ncbi:MAG: rhodanese-like domain-containing protein [Verrucomicrobiae bacterium]|nr:rhodanese-like domain-containing protein [Verrucomicrobiae bacterium]
MNGRVQRRLAAGVVAVAVWMAGATGVWGEESGIGGSGLPGVRHVDVDGAERLLREERGVVVLDVRTPREFSEGRIAGSTNLDFNHRGFARELAKLDREKTYLVTCAVGGRSGKALPLLSKLGFKSVVHLDGGVKAWEAAGKPVGK